MILAIQALLTDRDIERSERAAQAFEKLAECVDAERIAPSTNLASIHPLPRIFYTGIGDLDRYTDEGNARLNKARVQFDIFADTLSDASRISDWLKAALDNFKGTAADTRIERIYFVDSGFGRGDQAQGADSVAARVSCDAVIEYRTK